MLAGTFYKPIKHDWIPDILYKDYMFFNINYVSFSSETKLVVPKHLVGTPYLKPVLSRNICNRRQIKQRWDFAMKMYFRLLSPYIDRRKIIQFFKY